MADPPSDMFVKKAQFTEIVYRDVYPTVVGVSNTIPTPRTIPTKHLLITLFSRTPLTQQTAWQARWSS